ncbi:hypothetical protein KFL_000630260 [Klebsormidium nitens]|uniref:Uncharacterized protein n=1 Tax=Klebsormidium nitens TaxID=105231 RepID=A0A1Y1HRU9_KLENI|nr:hypothetical protein KFL_000630260 [Klebsormidium nitens]|eukprot:GAQ80823.1 hypothetical protein KFL_000630260 [Klebsormidium nitens]
MAGVASMAVRTAVLLLLLSVTSSGARRLLQETGTSTEFCQLADNPYTCYDTEGQNPVCCRSPYCTFSVFGEAECGPLCDLLSAKPAPCFNNDQSKFVCCGSATVCPTPGPEAMCGTLFGNVPQGTLRVDPNPRVPVVLPKQTSILPKGTYTLDPNPIFNPTRICDPLSSKPHQCFNRSGTQSVCCSGTCPAAPGDVAACH